MPRDRGARPRRPVGRDHPLRRGDVRDATEDADDGNAWRDGLPHIGDDGLVQEWRDECGGGDEKELVGLDADVEFDREPDLENLVAIKAEVEKVLSDVRSAVEDWSAMRERAEELASGLPTPADARFPPALLGGTPAERTRSEDP